MKIINRGTEIHITRKEIHTIRQFLEILEKANISSDIDDLVKELDKSTIVVWEDDDEMPIDFYVDFE